MQAKIAVLAGDGIGPEIMHAARTVLVAVEQRYGHQFEYQEALVGGAAYDEYGQHLPEETIEICRRNDAVLFGSVGGPVEDQDKPKWKDCEKNALLGLRGEFKLFANLRPVLVYPELKYASVLRPDILGDGFDLMIVRELTGGIYFGERYTKEIAGGKEAVDTMYYTTPEIRRIATVAFELALKRNKKVTSIDKANILDTSRLWREEVTNVAKDYPQVELNYMFVDNATQQMVKNPQQFDVMVMGNMFGDILSDLGSVLPGSLGLIPSASLGEGNFGLYEPAGGSAPRLAGLDRANPLAQILSAAMMLKYSFNLLTEYEAIEKAIKNVLQKGYRTGDIMADGCTKVGTKELGELIAGEVWN